MSASEEHRSWLAPNGEPGPGITLAPDAVVIDPEDFMSDVQWGYQVGESDPVELADDRDAACRGALAAAVKERDAGREPFADVLWQADDGTWKKDVFVSAGLPRLFTSHQDGRYMKILRQVGGTALVVLGSADVDDDLSVGLSPVKMREAAGVLLGLLAEGVPPPERADDLRAVSGDSDSTAGRACTEDCEPGCIHHTPSVGWDLSSDARLNVHPMAVNDGRLAVTLHLCGEALSTGVVQRQVTAKQVLEFARRLIELVGPTS